MVASTVTMTPSRVKMPQFMPCAMAESDLPKQVAHAQSGDGAKAANMTPAAIITFKNVLEDFTDS